MAKRCARSSSPPAFDHRLIPLRAGHAFALAQNDTLSIYSRPKSHSATSRFQLVASSPIHTFPSSHATSVYTSPLSFFASHTSDSPFTTLVYISRSGVVRNFSYHAGTHELVSVSPTNEEETDVSSVLPEGVEIVSVVPIPPSGQQAEEGEIAFVVRDSEGTLYRWTAQHGELEEGWVCEGKGDGVKTGLSGVEKLAVASDATSAIGLSTSFYSEAMRKLTSRSLQFRRAAANGRSRSGIRKRASLAAASSSLSLYRTYFFSLSPRRMAGLC